MSSLHEQLFQACYFGKSIEDVSFFIQQGANTQWKNPHYVSCCYYEVFILVRMIYIIIVAFMIII